MESLSGGYLETHFRPQLEADLEAVEDMSEEYSSPPSPGADLSREDKTYLSDGEGAGAPPCPEEEDLDEWVDDDDAGYFVEPITEEEFFEIEEVSECGVQFISPQHIKHCWAMVCCSGSRKFSPSIVRIMLCDFLLSA